jgi:hypothetical protein
MRMLCIAAAHDPIGYVAVAGRALGATDLARMTGGSEDEVQTLLGELDRNGVCSRDRHNRIYSRRMIRDAKAAAIARKNGRSGGNPTLRKGDGNQPRDNPTVKAPLKPHKPSATSPTEEETPTSQEGGSPPSAKSSAGSRLPEGWRPPENTPEYLSRIGLTVADGEIELEKFSDYWRRVPGAKGRSLDWNLNWKGWLRRAADDRKRNLPNGQRPDDSRTSRNINAALAGFELFAHAGRPSDGDQRVDPEPRYVGGGKAGAARSQG